MNNPDEGDKSSGTDGNDGGKVKSDSNDAQEGNMGMKEPPLTLG